MRTIVNKVGTWPFDAMKENPDAWVEISDEHGWYLLEVLPPIYFRGGFAVSEPARHTADDEPVYTCVTSTGKDESVRWFAREMTIREAPEAVRELRANLPSRQGAAAAGGAS